MTEIKKLTKIILIVDVILWLLFGVMLTFLYDMTMNAEGWTNPYHPRIVGGINLVAAIFAILMLRKKEWEEIKFLFEYFLAILLSTLIIEIAVISAFGATFGLTTILMGTMTIIIEASLFTLGIVVYLKQRS